MVVRMAVLYDLLAGPAGAAEPAEAPIGARRRLCRPGSSSAPAPGASLVVRGARVLDPAAGIDEVRDLVVRDGVVGGAADGPGGGRRGGAWSPSPGFVDPHVHLRTPGREDLEDIATGSLAAAAGGFVTIVAMPNTSPVVDTAPVLESLLERGEQEAVVRVGFLAAITVGQKGAELTEQVELARARARSGFSDDGHPVADAGVMRRALQYQRITGAAAGAARGGPHAVGRGRGARGRRRQPPRARRGSPRSPRASPSRATRPSPSTRAGWIHICHVSAAETAEEIRRAKARGVRITGEVTPAPPDAHRRRGRLARPVRATR